jgi:hypothetical protein
MADDRARKLAEDAFNRLAAELDAGKSEAFNIYLAAMGRFHRYSWGNVGLIAYNLNISRYISTATAESEIDLAATHRELEIIENKIQDATGKHNRFLEKLGLLPLPSPDSNSSRE